MLDHFKQNDFIKLVGGKFISIDCKRFLLYNDIDISVCSYAKHYAGDSKEYLHLNKYIPVISNGIFFFSDKDQIWFSDNPSKNLKKVLDNNWFYVWSDLGRLAKEAMNKYFNGSYFAEYLLYKNFAENDLSLIEENFSHDFGTVKISSYDDIQVFLNDKWIKTDLVLPRHDQSKLYYFYRI